MTRLRLLIGHWLANLTRRLRNNFYTYLAAILTLGILLDAGVFHVGENMRDKTFDFMLRHRVIVPARPVLVVKQAPKGSYQRVIVPVDFSPHSVQALKTAMHIAPSADITIIHAFDVPFEGNLRIVGVADEEIHRYHIQARQQALRKIGDLVGGLDAAPYRFRHVVKHGDAPRVILDKEQELEADLIVIGKHGQSIVEDLFLWSVTRHVLADAKCDVLVVNPGK